jgi:D-serine deaminase-like pyridoxal phosphate-dependent protein
VSEIGRPKSELDTPVLWVDLDLMERNIAHLARHFQAAGVQWRPHTKGIKVPAIAHQAIAAGAIGVTCAKLGEAEVMAAAGIRDILIANQIVGPIKISRLAHLRRHADVKVAVDDAANVAELGAAARAKGVELGIVVEVDTGMSRCGVPPGEPTVSLSRQVHQTPGLRYEGLMAWEGHAASISDPERKRREIEQAVGLLAESATRCRDAGLPVRIVSAGGSRTYWITSGLPGVTEIQAGGAMFCDAAYRASGVDTEPSLFVRAMVISRPTPQRIIFDAGFKAMPASSAAPVPVGLPGVESVRLAAEHATVTLAAPDATVKPGDAFDFMVGYGDSTVFLYDQLYGIRDGIVEVIWEIAGRGKVQ